MAMFIEDLRLLVVEPSHTQQKIFRDLLGQLGIKQVRTADNIEAAITEIGTDLPDAVLSAMHLPDGKAYDLLRRIRGDEEIADLPYLLVSSETRTQELEPVRQGGTVAILPKPLTKEDFQRGLGDALDLLSREPIELEDQDIEDLRVLVVDDSRTARKFVMKVLSQLGVEHIIEAENGVEATERLAESFFDLVLTDFHMPKMNGYELLDFIRTRSSQPHIPVLMVTSSESSARVAGVERAGVSAIVDKPFEISRIRGILENILA